MGTMVRVLLVTQPTLELLRSHLTRTALPGSFLLATRSMERMGVGNGPPPLHGLAATTTEGGRKRTPLVDNGGGLGKFGVERD